MRDEFSRRKSPYKALNFHMIQALVSQNMKKYFTNSSSAAVVIGTLKVNRIFPLQNAKSVKEIVRSILYSVGENIKKKNRIKLKT